MLTVSIATIVVVLSAGIAVIGWQSSNITHDISVREAKAEAVKEAATVKAAMEYGLVSAQNMTYALSIWTGILMKTLQDNEKLSGTWGAVIGNALDGKDGDHVNADYHDDSGVWRPYFFRNPDGTIGFRTITDIAEQTNILGVSSSANETGEAACHVRSSAEELETEAQSLREGVQGFLGQVREVVGSKAV